MSRLYVAVGSTAISAMGQLILRCREEDKADTELTFVAMDSDQGQLDRVKRLDQLNAGRVKTIKLELSRDDATSRLVHRFRERWVNLDISQDGVAGDRRRSFTCVNWQNDDFLGPVAELEQGDELVLMGTAFGGTSTGLFWNIAYRIRSIISGPGRQNHPDFYALIGLPAPPGIAQPDYPLAPNLCAFLQDMQTYEFGERVQRENMALRTISFSRYDGRDYLPIWTADTCGVSDHCYLPTDVNFVVPTPDSTITALQDTMAEQAFLLGPMELWKSLDIPARTIDLGPTGNTRNQEARCFSGFNMVTARSGKNEVLRRSYTSLLDTRWRSFRGGVSGDASPGKQWGQKILRRYMENTVPPFPEGRVLEPYRKMLLGTVPEIENGLENVLDELSESLRQHPYSWPGFDELMEELSKEDEKSIPPDLALRELESAYNEQLTTVVQTAASAGTVKDRMRQNIKTAGVLIRKRTKSKVAGIMGARGRAQSEVEGELREVLGRLIKYFVDACRSHATVPLLSPEPIDHDAELRKDAYKRLDECLGANAAAAGTARTPGFIAESDNAGVDLAPLHGVLDNTKLNSTILSILAVKDDADFESLVTIRQENAIKEMTDHAQTLGQADPLRQMTVGFGNPPTASTFSRVFQTNQLGSWENGFYIQMGAADSLSWEQIEGADNGFGLNAFATLDPDHVGNAEFDPMRYYNPANKGFYFGARDASPAGVHGVWIGTVKLDAKIKSILAQAYNEAQLRTWQLTVSRDIEQGGGDHNRLLTLPEFLALGAVFGAVESDLNKRVQQPGDFTPAAVLAQRFRLMKQIGQDRTSLTDRAVNVNDCFRQGPEQGLELVAIPVNWIEPLMKWISSSFWTDVGMSEFHNELTLEMNILTDIRLHIPKEVRSQLTELIQKTSSIVNIDWAGE